MALSSISSRSIIICVILVLTTFCSCNSVGPKSDKLVGEWVRNFSTYVKGTDYGIIQSPGFTMSKETITTLEKGGKGTVRAKSITVWDNNERMSNTSYTLEYPITWETKESGDEYCLLMKFGAGKIIDIQSQDKLKEEQHATQIMNISNGVTDTTYFTIIDDVIKWHLKDSDEDYPMIKR